MRSGAAFLLAGLALVGAVSNSLKGPAEQLRRRGETVAKAMLVQHFRSVNYAASNPGFAGAVSPGLLGLPDWHRTGGTISTIVDVSGQVTTSASVAAQDTTEIARALQELSGFSEGTGLARDGVVTTPGKPNQTVPGTVANLSPVITTRSR